MDNAVGKGMEGSSRDMGLLFSIQGAREGATGAKRLKRKGWAVVGRLGKAVVVGRIGGEPRSREGNVGKTWRTGRVMISKMSRVVRVAGKERKSLKKGRDVVDSNVGC